MLILAENILLINIQSNLFFAALPPPKAAEMVAPQKVLCQTMGIPVMLSIF